MQTWWTEVLRRALGDDLSIEPEAVVVRLARGGPVRLRPVAGPDAAAFAGEDALLLLEHADPRSLATLRSTRSSFVTLDGQIHLRGPGLLVDIRPSRRSVYPDRLRNPFSPWGLYLCYLLLDQPDRQWTVSQLAAAPGGVSQSFASRVVASLEDQGMVETTRSGVKPIPEVLFLAAAEAWPRPSAFFVGRVPSLGEAVMSGEPAYEHHGLAVPSRPRAYVRDRDQLKMLAVVTNASPSTARLAEWEATIQPVPLTNDIVPPLICALELGGDPRGREVIRTRQLVPWEVPG